MQSTGVVAELARWPDQNVFDPAHPSIQESACGSFPTRQLSADHGERFVCRLLREFRPGAGREMGHGRRAANFFAGGVSADWREVEGCGVEPAGKRTSGSARYFYRPQDRAKRSPGEVGGCLFGAAVCGVNEFVR